jgi:bacterioferritin (cytochrome b1)
MKIIKELTELVEEELEDAEKYIKLAFAHKDDNASLAKTFYELSTQEMNHVAMLHEEVVKIIEEHRKIKGDPPAAMMAVYDYLHKKHIDKASEIKVLQAEYRK